jgi:hypothetical protein
VGAVYFSEEESLYWESRNGVVEEKKNADGELSDVSRPLQVLLIVLPN